MEVTRRSVLGMGIELLSALAALPPAPALSSSKWRSSPTDEGWYWIYAPAFHSERLYITHYSDKSQFISIVDEGMTNWLNIQLVPFWHYIAPPRQPSTKILPIS